jgi:plastocyanin
MAVNQVNIPFQSANTVTPTVKAGDKVTWSNDTGQECTLVPPTCVSPHNKSETIADGDTSREYTVNNSPNGSYSYTYTVGPGVATRNGTIDVNTP